MEIVGPHAYLIRKGIKCWLLCRYCKPGYVQFVDGNDTNFQTQSQHWQKLHPDLNRPQFDESGSRVGLPPSWPPNFVMLAPEQQYAPARRKVSLRLSLNNQSVTHFQSSKRSRVRFSQIHDCRYALSSLIQADGNVFFNDRMFSMKTKLYRNGTASESSRVWELMSVIAGFESG